MTQRTSTPRGVTLFYDADCGVCSWIARRAVRAVPRGAVSAVALDSVEADPHLGKLSEEARRASWHVLGPDGQLRSAGAAAPVLLEQLPHAHPLARLVEAMPSTTERLYRLGASTRSLWGSLVPERSVARARRELALTNDNQSEREGRCTTIL